MNKKILFVISLSVILTAVTSESFAQKRTGNAKNFVVSNIPPQTYTGEPLTPPVNIREGRDLLQKDVDYVVEYINNVNAGTATVVIKAVAGGNYSESITKDFQIEKAKIAVLIEDKLGKGYGLPDPQLTYRIRSGELRGNDSFTGALVREPGETIGTYRISQGTLDAGPNYDLSVLGAGYFTITTAPITIRATPQKKQYGNKDPGLKYNIVEGMMLKQDSITGELTRMPGENVGKYAITQGTLSTNENYEIRFIRDYLEIVPLPITVKADEGQTKMFNDPDGALTYKITAGKMVEGELLRGHLTREPGEDIGNYNIKQGTLTAGDNYALTFIPAVFKIIQKPLNTKP